ncbi:ASF1 [Hepatospora eriocheir]|uniref:Anti-silencing function protein 1 n=1 Tax=Hepatospora eriocheir TaxID=1081669 RepID=A0A1X0QHJ4_9MICR|nr:ASF1 [Hepatospora eriocheir]
MTSLLTAPEINCESIELISDNKIRHDDPLKFRISFKTKNITEEVDYSVIYFGDSNGTDNDQIISHGSIGPFEDDISVFEIDTDPIDLTKIPITKLFGMTSVILVFKYKETEFLRVGYFINVIHDSIPNSVLVDEEEREEDLDEDVEIMKDDELDSSSEEECEESGEDEIVEDDMESLSNEENNDEFIEKESIEENVDKKEDQTNYEEIFNEMPKKFKESILSAVMESFGNKKVPLETPITNDCDEFEYKGHKINKNEILFDILKEPYIDFTGLEIEGDAV